MTDLIQDTGARGERPKAGDEEKQTAPKTTGEQTQGQESYAGPRAAGESDKPGAGASSDGDPTTNNAQTPPAGDRDPEETSVTDETGQAGVNDRPGKDQAHPWNG